MELLQSKQSCYTLLYRNKTNQSSPTQCVVETLLKQPDDRFVTTAISFLKCVSYCFRGGGVVQSLS